LLSPLLSAIAFNPTVESCRIGGGMQHGTRWHLSKRPVVYVAELGLGTGAWC